MTLQCSARGYPSPAVRWYKDSKLVHNDTSLELSSIKQSDAGLYACNASNVAGSDSRVVEVLVRGGCSRGFSHDPYGSARDFIEKN